MVFDLSGRPLYQISSSFSAPHGANSSVSICLGLTPKHSKFICHSHFVLDKNSTDPKTRSQRCFGSVGAAEPRAVARNTFHKRNPTTFQSNTTRICKVPIQNTATARRDQFLATRKYVFDPQGPSCPRPNDLPFLPRFWSPKHSFRDLSRSI